MIAMMSAILLGAAVAAGDGPAVGQPAPNLVLPANDGKTYELSQMRGQWVLVYFYPKDDTPGCTKQACSLRDSWDALQQAGVQVLGVSTDSVKSHRKFAEKYNLPFPLLADTDKQAVSRYDVKGMFFTKRRSFLIDPKGVIAAIFEDVEVGRHGEQVLDELKALKN